MRKAIHRALRCFGFRVERHRDPFSDMARIVRNVQVAVDGGAYHGGASRDFLRLFPSAQVHAFEANPVLGRKLAGELVDPRFTLHQQALSDSAGTLKFFLPNQDFTGSLLKPDESFGKTQELTVEATTLDNAGIFPDVMKLDLQGSELAALRGAKAILPNLKALHCEVNFVARYEGCAYFHEIAGYLADYGLRLFRLYEVHSDSKGQWQFADALFIRPELSA